MNKTNVNLQRKLNCKEYIIPLLIDSVLCVLVGCIRYFICSVLYPSMEYEVFWINKLPLISWVYMALEFLPAVLFLFYATLCYQRCKAAVLFPVVCAIIAARLGVDIYYDFIYFFEHYFRIRAIIDVIQFITFILLTVSVAKGLKDKKYVIIASVVGLLWQSCVLYYSFSVISELPDVFVIKFENIVSLISMIANILLYIAILLFGINNNIPELINVKKKSKKINNMPPEELLKILKEQYELGKLTEQEYQAGKADVVSRL